MPDVIPVPAEPADATAVRELVRSAYAPYVPRMGQEPAPMNADYARDIEDGDVHVVREAGELVAVVVTRGGGDHLLVENIAVVPARQSRGLGRGILAWTEARATSRGYDEVRLYTHETMVENIAFYQRHGFEITRVAAEDPFRRVHMRKVCAAR
ncbi:GNAT family N-acetyltransferase [Mumia sp. ZJ1417]|uniref:GNAT family N-acetyltransferase n=1 Tax=unclassified Mumia TaxID=2621872 RepID=UPI001423B636|nr:MULTISPECIES: GNAT family N-acetyltransferase [unclassified Mumia]QMW65315.1 GNAT family N-acetyltransferase [Mumia sp. ZJ1417]